MLTTKCPPRDFRVAARANSTKNRLYRCEGNLRGRKLAGIREEFSATPQSRKFLPHQLVNWLCWQSEANPPLPANLGNAGRFRQVARKAPIYPRRKSQHLNALDRSLPNLTSRENLTHSREGAERMRFSVHTTGAQVYLWRWPRHLAIRWSKRPCTARYLRTFAFLRPAHHLPR